MEIKKRGRQQTFRCQGRHETRMSKVTQQRYIQIDYIPPDGQADRQWTVPSFEAGALPTWGDGVRSKGREIDSRGLQWDRGGLRKRQTSRRITVPTSRENRGRSKRVVRKGRRRSRLDEPQAAACCPDRYSRSDLHKYERQQQHSTTPVSFQRNFQQRQFHRKEISSSGSKKESAGEIRRDCCSPTVTRSKQKLEKLSQRQRNSIFAFARAKLSSFVNRLSLSSGAGCAATRFLTTTSNITTANNTDLSSVISFHSRQNSQQNTVQTDPYSATTLSITASTSSVQCNASPNSNDGEYLHHLQKQKPATSSASYSLFQQTSYPAAVYLADGENSHLRMERLVPKEENEKWIRAPPNCNPFDTRASFTCSSLSCRVPVTQATYGRSRLNTATGIERPSSSGAAMTIRGNRCHGQKCTEQARSNDSLLTDCRQYEDGCFSSHLRWLSRKEFNENRSQIDSRPVVYVPVLCETVCNTNIHRAVTSSMTNDDNKNRINKPSSSLPSSSSLLRQISTTILPAPSTFASDSNADIVVADGCTSIPMNCNTDMMTHQPSGAKFDSPKEEEEERVEKLKDEIITGLSSQLVFLLFV
ncbi:hypothetical protein LOAG_16764 [Loa loa]|uniref:Non-specific serine/threonine protein kinase n=1 Tax=Loa loa TaxID=7209 RepID=A0A1I7VN25_LOALO|nr:hypothetical protein LOAG_16764 [Loa loa]EJD76230.1 hypothetical protein LOAG_16764 [Loa loa]